MSDKVGSNDSSAAAAAAATAMASGKPKLLRDVLLHHQNAANQVMHDKSIIEALKPNLLGLIAANQANSNAAAAAAAAAAMGGGLGSNGDVNPYAAYLAAAAAASAAGQSPGLQGSGNQQQQQMATTAALDIFAYCQYISSMMLFKAMANGENVNGSVSSNGLNCNGTGSDKTPSAPTSPLMSDLPQDYSMKGERTGKKRELSETAISSRTSSVFEGTTSPPLAPVSRVSEGVSTGGHHNKKANTNGSNESSKSNSHKSDSAGSGSSGRKFVSSERRPRQAYNTKQLERLESEFQVSVKSNVKVLILTKPFYFHLE